MLKCKDKDFTITMIYILKYLEEKMVKSFQEKMEEFRVV